MKHCGLGALARSQRPSDIFAVENLQCLLERFDFFLPASDAVLVADTRVDARWLEFVEIGQSGVQLLLGALKILLLLGQCLLLVLLLCGLVLNVCVLFALVNLGLSCEFIVLRLSSRFRCLGVRLKPGEVGLDDLEHTHNATALCSHALVWLVKDLWSLDESCCLTSLGVKLLEHCESLRHCGLGSRSIRDGLSILCLLRLPQLGGLGHGR